MNFSLAIRPSRSVERHYQKHQRVQQQEQLAVTALYKAAYLSFDKSLTRQKRKLSGDTEQITLDGD
jgi:hypothetical protein